ncbi:MAG TPA: hypothetical protein VJU86_02065 [Pyrinomonadaceae bacterium]|nr:hypothetical protein [Pyrinomonadaceae bacterium]
MHKAAIEGAQRARVQHKADMQEAFANALKKSAKQTPTASLQSVSSATAEDEIQKILSQEHLWNWNFSYSEIGQTYSGRRLDHSWGKIGERDNKEMIAAATLPLLAALATGIYTGVSWQNFFTGIAAGVGAGLITLIATFSVIFLLHWLVAPREIDAGLRGDLEAARNQLAEEERKLRSLATTARRRENELRQIHETENKVLMDQARENAELINEQREQIKIAREQAAEIKKENASLSAQLAKQDHKVIPYVVRELSHVYLASWMKMPAVIAVVGLKFENLSSDEIALKRIQLGVRERLEDGSTRELALRGSESTVLHPITERIYGLPPAAESLSENPFAMPIEGFRVKAKHLTGAYFFANHTMAFDDDFVEVENGKTFLRLTVEAVAQKPYMINIEVDWKEPGTWILSSTPVEN